TLLAIGNSYTTPALNSPTTYFLEVGRGSCVNAGRTAVQVKISNPQAPVVGSTGTNVCSGSATTLSVSSPQAGETYNWYSAAVAGSLLGTGSSFTTPVLTSNQSYYVETAQGSCLSPSRTEVDVMINNPQAPIVSSTGTTICSGSVTTLSVSSPQAGETYNWYSAAVSGSLLGTGNSFTTPVLTSNQSYYVETIIGSCNSSSRTKVTVIVNDPQAPTVQTSAASVCAGQAVTATITNPQIGVGYNWYKQASGGAVFYSGTSLVLDTLTASRTFYVEAVQGTCISPTRTAVTLLISPDPAVTLESSNVTICSGSSVDLKASASSGVEIRWYTSQTGGSTVFTGNVFTTPSLTSNTTYYVEGRNTTTNCVSLNRVSVKVNVQNVPPTPIVNASTVSICSGSTATLTATSTVTGVTFNWYDVQSGGTLLATGASYSTPVLTTDKTYYVESVFTSSGCNGASARVAANVQVVNQPPTPIVVSPLTICAGQRAMLEAQSPTGGILYKWYTSESGGSPIYVGSMYETPIITSTTKYYVEASLGSGSCGSSSRSEIVINVNALPNAPIVTTSTTTILSGATATLMASVSQAGIVIDWYTSPVGGAAIATGTSYTTPPLNGSTSYYVEARNLSTGCVSSLRIETKVIVDYNSPNPCDPTPPSITTPNLAVCKNQPFVITASANNTIYWYDAQTGGNLLAVGQTYAVNGLSANATYYAETKDPDCSVASLRVPAMVSVLTNPPAPTVDFNNISVCKGETFTIKASSPFSGVIFKWYSTSAGGTSMFTGDYFTTPPVTSNTSYYVEALLSGGCTCSCRTEVKLSVAQPLPSPIVRCVDSPSNTITFGWDPIPGATGYQVSVNDGIYTAPTSGVTGTTHVITGVMPGEGRTISVIALANPACSNSIASVVQSCSADDYVDFFIPNAFSPNHDGNNDVLFARGTITKIKFKIYNQWGQLLFESNDHNKGWDGTFSGKEQPIGVYVYVAQATLINGKEVMKKGSINLIR
ncbi:Ig-like domain-containing protein, partial [Solitalea koreensis]